jgi:hypothetical protein
MIQRPIPGFDGYTVTDTGLVYGRWGRPISPYLDKDGYLRVTIALGRGKDALRIHRGIHQLVCLTFHGDGAGLEARHLDGNQRNNTPDNLAWGTRQQNSDDRTAHGHVPKGESHGMAKLTEDAVFSIRAYLAMGIDQRQIAGWFNVSQSAINHVSTQKTWR